MNGPVGQEAKRTQLRVASPLRQRDIPEAVGEPEDLCTGAARRPAASHELSPSAASDTLVPSWGGPPLMLSERSETRAESKPIAQSSNRMAFGSGETDDLVDP